MMQKAFSIAIDGPVAAGKGVVARELAHRLHGFHLNTGSMYRALALYCLKNGIGFHEEEKVIEALKRIVLSLGEDTITMDGVDVTEEITNQDVAQGASDVGTFVTVRKEMVKRQRKIVLEKIAKGQVMIIDARDGATDIVPDAQLKIFLTANAEVRAKRRLEQLGGQGNFEQILEDIKKRDYQDTHRSASPLVLDPEKHGYFIVDTSLLTQDETIEVILSKIKQIL